MEYGIWYISAGFLGCAIGSFITMLVYRLHEGGSIVVGRSHCISCKQKLRWFELIPLLSFLFLRGRCNRCKTKIPVQYFLIEFATTILFVYALHNLITRPVLNEIELIRDWIIIAVLVFVFAYDAIYMEVHPTVTIGGGFIVGIINLLLIPADWVNLALGVLIGVGWFLIQYLVSKGRWIGSGDIMIGFFMGATLGVWRVVLALGIAYVVGAAYGITLMILKKKQRKDQIAFGTFLAIGSLVALIWGATILQWYQQLLV